MSGKKVISSYFFAFFAVCNRIFAESKICILSRMICMDNADIMLL